MAVDAPTTLRQEHPGPLRFADAHNDLLLGCLHRSERGVEDPFGDDWLPGLRAGGLALQVLPMFTEEQFIGEGALRRTLELIEVAHDIAQVHSSDVVLALNSDDIDDALATNRIALVLALEGAEPIGSSVTMFETMWRLGIRMASLTWNRRTMFADGIGETDTGGRLSSLGIEAIAEMDRLGMIIDVSHLSAPGVAHIADLTSSNVIATHSSCRAICDHPRNLTDQQLRLIGDADGWVGINAFAPFIHPSNATTEQFIDHIEHAAALIGDDRVGLGTDFVKDLIRFVDPVLGRKLLVRPEDISYIERLQQPADLPLLGEAMIERFGLERSRQFAGSNLIDYFRGHLPAAHRRVADGSE